MAEDIRIWEILEENNLRELTKSKLDLEERIEAWLEKDISIISKDLLIIGRQIETDFGGIIDLLCLDTNGDIVIMELKRNKTPRDVVSQIMDYASWVRDLSHEKVSEIANKYLAEKGPIEEAFKIKFGIDLPEILNNRHKMLIVASEIDSCSERIIKYLSDSYGVAINAATFQYLKSIDGKEFLAKLFLIEPSQVEYSSQTKTTSKWKPNLTYEDLKEIAEKNGVGEIYDFLNNDLKNFFDKTGTTKSSIAFLGTAGGKGNIEGKQNTILSIIPKESNNDDGLKFNVYNKRFAKYFEIDDDSVDKIFPNNKYLKDAPDDWSSYVGYFKNIEGAKAFLIQLKEIYELKKNRKN
jgi:hypothetical protein